RAQGSAALVAQHVADEAAQRVHVVAERHILGGERDVFAWHERREGENFGLGRGTGCSRCARDAHASRGFMLRRSRGAWLRSWRARITFVVHIKRRRTGPRLW